MPRKFAKSPEQKSGPAMVFADLEHGGENVIPGFSFHHDIVRKHAAVPADVLEFASNLPDAVAQPVTGVTRDVQLAVGVGGKAMAAGFVVRAGAFHGGVILRDVEINRPGA